jgi:hypothetical protein
MLDQLPLDEMTSTGFEQFCFDLLREVGFVNVDWRKGTGTASSPSDSGRDIVAYMEREDLDGTKHLEKWFVDCKHHKHGVPPREVTSLLAWATAERPHVALVIASNFLSNPCKDFLKEYELNNRPPFRIRYWERPILERMVEGRDEFLQRLLRVGTRSQGEILAAEQEMFDRVWYDRKLVLEDKLARGEEEIRPDILAGMRKYMREVEAKLGEDNLGPYDDFEWGMINGKLSALRWVLGDEWDMLDT